MLSPKMILVVLALLCFAAAGLDFYSTRLIGAGLFLFALSTLV